MNRTKMHLLLPAALISGALILSACGNDTKDSSPNAAAGTTASPGAATPSGAVTGDAAARNDADVKFAQEMIAHHRGAIAMAKLAGTRAANADVKALAVKIEAAQDPEIATMSAWLKSWGKEVPAADSGMGGAAGMDHGNSAMPGMMTDQEMAGLEKSMGADFDTMFLQMMTKHHEGAITMAKEQQSKGQNADAKALAAKIVADQTAELADMARLSK